MLESSLDESGVSDSPYFLWTALVTRAARGKISLVWCHLFIEMENLNKVKEMGRQEISESIVTLNLFFLLYSHHCTFFYLILFLKILLYICCILI